MNGQRAPRRPSTDRANVFVPADHRLYPAMVERAATADHRDVFREPGRAGIWVPAEWVHRPDRR